MSTAPDQQPPPCEQRRRRRWDDPTDLQDQQNVTDSPPVPTNDSTPAVLNVEEAKRIASQRAAQLSAKLQPAHHSSHSNTSLPTLISNEHFEVAPGIIATARHATASGFTQDVDINDCRNRYLLTKALTQQEIRRETGCEITTRGQYLPDRAQSTAARPPLHLHMSATTKEALDLAVEKIKELMDRPADPALTERASFVPRHERRPDSDDPQNRSFSDRPGPPMALTEKVFIEFGSNDRRFNVRAKVVGPKGAYVKHIQSTTGVRIQLKGQGSGYTETATGRESDEPLHVFLWTNMGEKAMDKAKELLADLLSQVQLDFDKFTEAAARARDMPPLSGGPYSYNAMTAGLPPTTPTSSSGVDERDRDRPSMSQFPTDPSMYIAAATSAAYEQPQYLYQPPYGAPDPPKHIVKSGADMALYSKYYVMFYAYYYQLVASGQALPVVEVPPAPVAGQEETGHKSADSPMPDSSLQHQDSAAPANEPPASDQRSELPATETHAQVLADAAGASDAADNAAQWAQYYQYYAAMQGAAPPAQDGDPAGALPLESATGGPQSEDPEVQSQWAAYYAQYYAAGGVPPENQALAPISSEPVTE